MFLQPPSRAVVSQEEAGISIFSALEQTGYLEA